MSNRNKTRYINPKNPLISFITPTHNRPDWLQLTLQSMIDQSYQFWECILVNDFGVSVENVVKKFNDPRIKYFENNKNLDLAGTRNVALTKYQGDYGLFLDDDDIVYKDCLNYRLWRMKTLGVDVVYSRVLQSFYNPTERGYEYAGEKLYWRSNFDRDLILVQNISPVNGVMWSRKAQEAAGQFDETLTTSEDWSFWVEMSRKYDFHESHIIDCQCSYRMDNSQMSGSRTGFTDHMPYLYGKWRKYAENYDWVVQNQNNSMRSRGLNPADYNL